MEPPDVTRSFAVWRRQGLHSLALWLGLVALTVQGLAPLCLAGMMGAPAGGAGLYSIVLCTAHGFQTIRIGADGKPAPDAPAPDQQGSTCLLCAGCHAGGGFTTPVLASTVAPSLWTRQAKQIVFTIPIAPRLHFSYVTRAPPATIV